MTYLFETLVDPWIDDAAIYGSESKTWPCSSKPNEFDKQFDKRTASKASEAIERASEIWTSTDAVAPLTNTLNKVNTTLDKLIELLSKTTSAAATTRT